MKNCLFHKAPSMRYCVTIFRRLKPSEQNIAGTGEPPGTWQNFVISPVNRLSRC